MGTLSLDAAMAAHDQAAADLRDAIDDALSRDAVADRLAMHVALDAMRYIERQGLTVEGRRKLRTGIAAARSALGLEGEA